MKHHGALTLTLLSANSLDFVVYGRMRDSVELWLRYAPKLAIDTVFEYMPYGNHLNKRLLMDGGNARVRCGPMCYMSMCRTVSFIS